VLPYQIKQGIAALKQSGRYEQILQEVMPEEQSQESTEEAEEEEETTQARPRRRRRQRHERIFDERCLSVFATENQSNAFRSAVTAESARRFIPVDRQLPLACEANRQLRATTSDPNDARGSGRQGGPFIRTFVSAQVREAIQSQRRIAQEERERLISQQRVIEMQDRLKAMASAMRTVVSNGIRLKALFNLYPELKQRPEIGR
jgi:hypothetical protein